MNRKKFLAIVGICLVLATAIIYRQDMKTWFGSQLHQTNVENAEVIFDKDGVPILKIEGVGEVRHPGWIALYALAYAGVEKYDDKMNFNEDRAKFTACINWLESNLVKNGQDNYVWEYNFDNTYNDITIEAPWTSAFGQAVGIQALIAAYKIDGDNKHLDLAEKAAKVLFVPIDDHGLLFTKDEDIWFEEIPVPAKNPSHILNGHMRTLLALKELADATGNTGYQYWLSRGLTTLERWLPLYDSGYALRYDLNPKKSELLFRFNNPYGYQLSEVPIDKIIIRDPVNQQAAILDVGETIDPEGAMRIAGNDWGQQEQLDGRSIRRLKPTIPAISQEEAGGEMKAPYTYFYVTLPYEWKDNLRSDDYELEIVYKDEAPGNITVQIRSIAPGPAFRDLRDGDLFLSGSGQWKSWKIPLRTSDLGWWVGNTYAGKHAQYLDKLSGDSKVLLQWSKVAAGYLNLVKNHTCNITQLEKMVLPTQTPMLPVYSFDENGVVMQHSSTANTKWFGNGLFDPSGDRGTPVYQYFVICSQLLQGDSLAGAAYSSEEFKSTSKRREPALTWLMNPSNYGVVNDAAVYYYNFSNAYNDVYTQSPWQSAFGQAYVLKALKYALDNGIGNSEQVKSQLERSANAYTQDVQVGCLVTPTREEHLWAEEVPNATHVLNAHLVSTATLAEVETTLSNSTINNTRQNLLAALKDNLYLFDTGYWSRYDQNPKKELLFQIDWLQGSDSPLIDAITLENPQTKNATQIDLGSPFDFIGYPHLAGVDWQTVQLVDGVSVRSFSNGYSKRSQVIPGGSQHNVFFMATLPDRQFDNSFDIAPHRLVIRYKDIAPGEYNIKIQCINNGNTLEFIPLRGGILRCVGDGQWKEAVFNVRPQDLGWFMGEDYQTFHIAQLSELAKQTNSWFLAQYSEKWQYYYDCLKNGKPVVIEYKSNTQDVALESTILESFQTYPGFDLTNALDGDPNDDYVAGIENQLPAEFTIKFKQNADINQFNLTWESESNYGIDYDVYNVLADGTYVLLKEIRGAQGKVQKAVFDRSTSSAGLKLVVKSTSGQPRVLLRSINVF